MSKLQEEILRAIPNGYRSKALLKKFLMKNNSVINDSMTILLKKDLIMQKGEKKDKPGKPEKFYILTDSGIEELIKKKISPENFWKLVFFVFDEENRNELRRTTVDDLFDDYERNTLMISREYSTPLYDWILTYFQYLKKRSEILEPAVRILLILAKTRPLRIKEILVKLKIPKSYHYRYYSSKPNSSAIINDLIKYLLITKKSGGYQLTHFGILLLLTEIHEEKSISREILKEENTREIVRIIVNNYRGHFPVIFENWNILSRILTEKELVTTFKMALDYEESLLSHEPMHNGGLYEIFAILKTIRRSHLRKLDDFLTIGKTVRDDWMKQNQKWQYFEQERTILLNLILTKAEKISLPNSIDAVLARIAELVMETVPYDLQAAAELDLVKHQLNTIYQRSTVRLSIVNLVTFLFYTLIAHQVRFKLDILRTVNEHSKTSTNDDMNKITKNWNLFINKNMDFIKSYSNWISNIVEFEAHNIDFIKKLSALSIRSSDEERGMNLSLAREMVTKIKSKSSRN